MTLELSDACFVEGVLEALSVPEPTKVALKQAFVYQESDYL